MKKTTGKTTSAFTAIFMAAGATVLCGAAGTPQTAAIASQIPNEVIIGIAAIITIAVVAVLFRIFALRSEHAEQRRKNEQEVFLAYLCQANDYVSEQDMLNKKRYGYHYINGEIKKEEVQYIDGNAVRELVHPDDIDAVIEHFRFIIDKDNIEVPGSIAFDCRIKNEKTGEYRWTRCLVQKIKKDANHPNNICSMRRI